MTSNLHIIMCKLEKEVFPNGVEPPENLEGRTMIIVANMPSAFAVL